MHIDLVHTIITVGLIFGTLWGLGRLGIIDRQKPLRFDWRAIASVALVVFIFNLIWPA